MTAIAQSMLNGPPVMLSTAHLTPSEVARWVAHQRVQLEASTFDNRTLTTTISEKSWKMIMFKIETSRTLLENPSKNWRQDWNVYTFLRALKEVYALEPKDCFMESTASIWYELRGTLHVDLSNMHKLSETYVAALVEEEHLHPIPPEDLYQVLKDLLYA